MGSCYENGKGTPKNLLKAHEWYKYAAIQGHSSAKQNIENLKKQNIS
ncbi:MAG: hypothetical protein LBU56_00855 [Rickettsiales bacterium]|nr:hypothetical protein [Rickettsiales bacterium]